MSGRMPEDIVPCDAPTIYSKSFNLIHNILEFVRIKEWVLVKDYRNQLIEYTLYLETELAKMKRHYRQPTHGTCCTCQKCGQDYDDCRCTLDEVAEENVALRIEVEELRKIILDSLKPNEIIPMVSWQPEPIPWRHPIICPHCKQDTGYTQEGLSGLYMPDDLHCPRCGKIVVYVTKTTC